MKPLWVILFALSLSAPALHAQERGIYTRITQEVIHGDTVTVAELMPVFVFPRKIDTRRFAKLVENLKKVYPIAKEANRLLQEMEKHMGTLNNSSPKRWSANSRSNTRRYCAA